MVNKMSQPKVALKLSQNWYFPRNLFFKLQPMSDGWLKKVSSLNFSRRWRFPLLSPRSLSSAWFYFEIRPFLSEMPEMCSATPFTVQIKLIREQQEKNREKAAREASKIGESGSLTEDGKLYRCRSFNSIFYLLKKNIFFVNSVKQVSANFLEAAL